MNLRINYKAEIIKTRKPKAKRDYDGKIARSIIDVRPLNVRESKMNTRKGMTQTSFNSHINDRNIINPLWHECTDQDRKAF